MSHPELDALISDAESESVWPFGFSDDEIAQFKQGEPDGETWVHIQRAAQARDRLNLLKLVDKALGQARDAIHLDRTGLAAALAGIRKVISGYRWIPAGEWGSYEWNKRTVETLQHETGEAFDQIDTIAIRALSRSGDLAGAVIQGDTDKTEKAMTKIDAGLGPRVQCVRCKCVGEHCETEGIAMLWAENRGWEISMVSGYAICPNCDDELIPDRAKSQEFKPAIERVRP